MDLEADIIWSSIEPACSTQCSPSGRKWLSFDWTIVCLDSKSNVNHKRASAGSLPRPVRACGSGADVRRRCLGRGVDILKLLTFEGQRMPLSPGGRRTVRCLSQAVSFPGSREIKHARRSQTARRTPGLQHLAYWPSLRPAYHSPVL